MNKLIDHNKEWEARPDLTPNSEHPFPSGTRLRIHKSAGGLFGYIPEGIETVETTIYWIRCSDRQEPTARLSFLDRPETCRLHGFGAFNGTDSANVNGWTSWFTGVVPGQIEKIEEDGTVSPPPPKPAFRWPSADLKNLVIAAPTSPYTRALLRGTYNKPLPPEAMTPEAIEEFLASLPPVEAKKAAAPPPAAPAPAIGRRATQRQELIAGEYVDVDGRREGTTTQYESWTKSGTVRVPLSVFEECEYAVKDYVKDEVDNMEPDYGNTDYGDTDYGDFEIDSDMTEVMEEAERLIAERDGTNDEEED